VTFVPFLFFHHQSSVQEGGPVTHVSQTVPFGNLLRNPDPIILDGKLQVITDLVSRDLDVPGA